MSSSLNCTVCESNVYLVEKIKPGKSVIDIYQCPNCMAVINFKPLERNDKTNGGESFYAISAINSKSVRRKVKQLAPLANFISNKVAHKVDLLEFGAGAGFLSLALVEFFDRVHAVDKSISLLETTINKYGRPGNLECFESLDLLPEDNLYSVIVSWHVFEHLHDPVYYFESLLKKLEPDGVLVIQVPLYRTRYVDNEHITFFNLQTFSFMTEKTNSNLTNFGFDVDNSFITVTVSR